MYRKILSVLLAILMLACWVAPLVSAQDGAAVLSEVSQREYLGELLNNAVNILQSPDLGAYPADACERLELAMGEAYGVYYNPNATETEVNAQVQQMEKALADMKKSNVSEDIMYYLTMTIEKAETEIGPEANYTPESWAVFEEALIEAKRVQKEAQNNAQALDAAESLVIAMDSLEVVDSGIVAAREYLRSMINMAYRTLDSGEKYTEESRSQLEAAIEDADALYYSSDATIQQLYFQGDMIINIINSMETIDVSPSVVAYLSDAIAMADATVGKEEDYTADSWTAYAKAYSEAVRVLNAGESEDEFIAAANTLAAAVDSLVLLDAGVQAAKDGLLAVINSANSILNSGEKYTADSVTNLETAIKNATDLLIKENATEQELNAEASKIQEAIDSMEKITVSEEVRKYLSDIIAKAENEVGAEEDYTPDSYSKYHSAYLEAVRVLSEGMSDEEFTVAANTLGNAIEGLVSADAQRQQARAELLSLIGYGVPEGSFTPASLASLKSAIKAAQAVYDDENATQELICEHIALLQDAINSLVEDNVSPEVRTALADVIAYAEKIEESKVYSDKGWKNFTDALISARNIYATAAIDDLVIVATNNLNEALEGLRKDALATLKKIVDRGAPVGGNYTPESYGALIDALENAREVYNNGNASLEEILLEIQKVHDAYAGLKTADISPEAKQTLGNVIETSQIVVGEKEDYTPESFTVYQDAYAQAMATYFYGQSDVEYYMAAQKLQSAIDSLVPAVIEPATPDEEISTPDEVFVLLGDTDSDGKVTIKDATLIQKNIAGIAALSDLSFFAADANRDGSVNIKDATEIQKHLASLPANENIGKDILFSKE